MFPMGKLNGNQFGATNMPNTPGSSSSGFTNMPKGPSTGRITNMGSNPSAKFGRMAANAARPVKGM